MDLTGIIAYPNANFISCIWTQDTIDNVISQMRNASIPVMENPNGDYIVTISNGDYYMFQAFKDITGKYHVEYSDTLFGGNSFTA